MKVGGGCRRRVNNFLPINLRNIKCPGGGSSCWVGWGVRCEAAGFCLDYCGEMDTMGSRGCSCHLLGVIISGGCTLELETKVHPKVRNHREGPY